jgi:hypothetical protein
MHWKHITEGIIIICCVFSNYNMINTYNKNYVPDKFTIKHLIKEEYRCIRYFSDDVFNRYQNTKCKNYLPNYIEFILQKSRYITLFYLQNFLVIIVVIIINLL